jgi:peptidoglycan/xylan/chitin deacetylase (PgdA/CDA1 family)
MKFSISAKKAFGYLFDVSGYSLGKIEALSQSSVCILAYHRIMEVNRDFIQPGMYVTPKTFSMQINLLKSRASIIPLSQLLKIIMSPKSSTEKKPFCAITFDDGWHDFYQNAFPILKSLNVPATNFLPTNFIGTDRWFWTDRLAEIWKHKKKQDRFSPGSIAQKLMGLKGSFEAQIEKAIEILKDAPLNQIEKVLGELTSAWSVPSHNQERIFLNWREVREMQDTGLISFGSHTTEHQILTTINENEIRKELQNSKQKLSKEGVIENLYIPFCYPNGDYTTQIAQLVKEAGYSCAVTTRKGWNDSSSDSYSLKRINMHQDVSSTKGLFLSRLVKAM